jgi:hypothetical protein
VPCHSSLQAERRAAEQYAADLQKQIAREKALAEAEGRIKEARDNEDVNRRAALLRYQEEVGAWGWQGWQGVVVIRGWLGCVPGGWGFAVVAGSFLHRMKGPAPARGDRALLLSAVNIMLSFDNNALEA